VRRGSKDIDALLDDAREVHYNFIVPMVVLKGRRGRRFMM
jgi:hypothetical protein